MASATATANPEAVAAETLDAERGDAAGWRDEAPPARLPLAGSRLGRLILGLNLLGLAVLIVGALVLNEMGRGLISARIDSLTTQGELIANVIAGGATQGAPEPALDPGLASEVLQLPVHPALAARAPVRRAGRADRRLRADRRPGRARGRCRPARRRDDVMPRWPGMQDEAHDPARAAEARAALAAEVRSRALPAASVSGLAALRDGRAAGQRLDPDPARAGGAGRADPGGRRRRRDHRRPAQGADPLHPDRRRGDPGARRCCSTG